MSVAESRTDEPKPSICRFHITPGLLIAALLVTEGSLYLFEWFRWLHKGWPVLIALAAVSAVILVMLVWFAVALVFRWRFQFSLRSLLVLTAVVAILGSWLSWEMKEARMQRAALDAIEGFDVMVFCDYQINKSGELDILADPPRPEWLLNAFGDDFMVNAVEVCLSGNWHPDWDGTFVDHSDPQVADALLPHIEKLPALQTLVLHGILFNDAWLERLKGFVHLSTLRLIDTQVTHDGVRKLLQALPNCKIEWSPPTPPTR